MKKNKSSSKNLAEKMNFFQASAKFIKEHLIAIIAVLIAFVIVLGSVFTVISLRVKIPDNVVFEYNGEDATPSTVSKISISESEQLKKYDKIKRKIHGKKSKFKFYANDYVEIDDLFLEGTISFGNLSMNDCTMILTIVDEEDDIIYNSMGIAPGRYLPRLSLIKDIAYGVHKCKMYVSAFNSSTYELIDTQQMNITVVMGAEYGEEAEK